MLRSLLFATAALVALGGCATSRPDPIPAARVVHGTVTNVPDGALPPDAVVTVRLLDVSLADAPSVTLAQQSFRTEGRQGSLPFALVVPPGRIHAVNRYVVRAEIHSAAGALLWTTDTAYPVLTQGAPADDVALRVVPAAPPPPPPPDPQMPAPPARARTLAYDCTDPAGAPFRITVWLRDDEATVWLPSRFGGGSALLDRVRTDSGTRYEGDGVAVVPRDGEARLEVRGTAFDGCRAAG